MTIKEIARICNVSTSTVSNVLNGKNKVGDETTKRILDVIKATGYKPNAIAKGLRTQSTKMIGVIVEDVVLFNIADIINGITEYCEENGYSIILENMRLYAKWHDKWFNDPVIYSEALKPVIGRMESLQVDGIIYVAGHARNVESIRENTNIPVVMAYAIPNPNNMPYVLLDDEQGGYEITKYLIDKGHRNIGVICGEKDNYHTIMRVKGYQKALKDNRITPDACNLIYTKWTREGGYNVAKEILDRGVSAVVCMSDIIASGLYDYCSEEGIEVGEDISVIGYDNHIVAQFLKPQLTTYALPLIAIGQNAAILLLGLLNNEYPTDNMKLVSGSVLERGSVKELSLK